MLNIIKFGFGFAHENGAFKFRQNYFYIALSTWCNELNEGFARYTNQGRVFS